MKNDTQLVQRFQAGDRDAFAELIRRYQNYIASIAYSATGDFARSEDIAQQAFLTAWQRQAELKDPRRWSGWLRGIVRNLLRNSWRRDQVERRHREALQHQTHRVESHGPLDQCLERERSEMVWSVLEQIPETYREPLVLFYREGNSVEAVAALMDLSVDAVKQRLSRGRKLVRAEIESMVEETLFETRPSSRLTASVMAAIPAASSHAAAKTAGTTIGTIVGTKWLAILVGPLVGIAGGILGSKMALDATESWRERSAVWRMIVWTTLLVVALLAVQMSVAFGWPAVYGRPLFHVVLWGSYLVILFWMIMHWNRKLATIRAEENRRQGISNKPHPQAKPVSTLGLRLNILGTLIGIQVAPMLMAGITGDWIGLVVTAAVVAAECLVAWVLAPSFRTAPQQIRFNAGFCLVGTLVLATTLLVRWDAWQSSLAKPFQPDWPGWIWAAGVFCFGLGLFVMLTRQARRLETASDHDDAQR